MNLHYPLTKVNGNLINKSDRENLSADRNKKNNKRYLPSALAQCHIVNI